MPDAESFIAAIAANPVDDLPRLVFADWLDENGDPTRAGFIRDHVRLAKLRPGTDEYKTLFRKCADTLKANLPAWIKPACDAFGQPAEWKPGKAAGGRFGVQISEQGGKFPLIAVGFDRGFLDDITLNIHGNKDLTPFDQVLKEQPVTHLIVRLGPGKPFWHTHLTERFRAIHSLTIRGDSTSLQSVGFFNSPRAEGVRRLDISRVVGNQVVLDLCRSPMARRLNSLRVSLRSQTVSELTEFPLDDKLQELVLYWSTPSRWPSEAEPERWSWSALSRVAFRPTLKRLDLTRCGMTDDGLAAFARGEEWVRLQGLKLGGNLFGDTGWSDFCRGWRTPELTYLDASRNRLTDAGAEMLARSGMLKTLRVIDLRGNHIAGRGAVALARAVAEGKLNKLLLAGNPVGKREAATVKGLLGGRTDLA